MQLKKIKPKLDPPSFIYQCKQPILNRSEKPIKNADDEYEYKEHPHKGSLPNLEFLMMNDITTNSHTDEWYDVFVPRNRKRKFSEGFTSISDTTLFTNKKVYLLNSGKGGTQYPKCTPLSVDEIMRHIGIYMLNGIFPSTQVETKFESKERNPTNGNDICNRVFGTCVRRRHKDFKDFLAIQDTVKPVPSRKTHPK